jgi:hypothetical protein
MGEKAMLMREKAVLMDEKMKLMEISTRNAKLLCRSMSRHDRPHSVSITTGKYFETF